MHGIEVIPIYVVTTPKSPRIEVTQQHFDELGLEVVWFEGINNHTFGLSSRVPWDGEGGHDECRLSPLEHCGLNLRTHFKTIAIISI